MEENLICRLIGKWFPFFFVKLIRNERAEIFQDFYETTLEALKDAKNERLWFKTMTKLGKLYFDREDYGKLSRILKQLHSSCTTQEGEDDLKKGTQLLEIYALEIQMYTAQKNNKKLKALYDQSLHIKSAIPHPLILGTGRQFIRLKRAVALKRLTLYFTYKSLYFKTLCFFCM